MKKLLYSSLFQIIFLTFLSAQIHIGPTIGINRLFTDGLNEERSYFLESHKKKFLFGGLKLEFPVTNKLFVSYDFMYDQKEYQIEELGINPLLKITFSNFYSNLLINRITGNNFSIGGGIDYLYIPSIKGNRLTTRETFMEIFEKQHRIGVVGGITYKFWNIVLDLNLSMEVLANQTDTRKRPTVFNKINIVQIGLSYLFKTSKKRSVENARF